MKSSYFALCSSLLLLGLSSLLLVTPTSCDPQDPPTGKGSHSDDVTSYEDVPKSDDVNEEGKGGTASDHGHIGDERPRHSNQEVPHYDQQQQPDQQHNNEQPHGEELPAPGQAINDDDVKVEVELAEGHFIEEASPAQPSGSEPRASPAQPSGSEAGASSAQPSGAEPKLSPPTDIESVVENGQSPPTQEETKGDDSSTTSSEAVQEPELTADEKYAKELYDTAEKMTKKGTVPSEKAHQMYVKAAEVGHKQSEERVAFNYFYGDSVAQNLTLALEMMDDLSSEGRAGAQLGLAMMHTMGLEVNSSQARALVYFTFSALGGDHLAQMALGYRYLRGISVQASCETALTYYSKAAALVADEASVMGGRVLQRVRLAEEADPSSTNSALLDDDLLQYYEFLADKGDVSAQVGLGQLYLTGGRGVEINHQRALRYFMAAAEQGKGEALAFLGRLYSGYSDVVEKNHDIAFTYFKRAAEKLNPMGQSGLGLCYQFGHGVAKDYALALKYYQLAADQGSVDGQLQLAVMYHDGLGVKQDYKMALKYFNLAAQGGNVLAFYNLARMHATGTGVMRTCLTAVELYKDVAERGPWAVMMMDAHSQYVDGFTQRALTKYLILAELGYEVAQSNAAYILDQGHASIGTKNDTYRRSLLQWLRAAGQGSTLARLKIGDYHYYGLGTEVDYEQAASHYRMASDQQQSAQAMFNLGYMHELGLGLPRDLHLAKRFYDLASETSEDAAIPVALALTRLSIVYFWNSLLTPVGGTPLGMDSPCLIFRSLMGYGCHDNSGHLNGNSLCYQKTLPPKKLTVPTNQPKHFRYLFELLESHNHQFTDMEFRS